MSTHRVPSTQFTILAGPNEETLFNALRQFRKNPEWTIQFTISTHRIINVRVNNIGAGSGDSEWVVKGFVKDHPLLTGNFVAYYNSMRNRSGSMNIEC